LSRPNGRLSFFNSLKFIHNSALKCLFTLFLHDFAESRADLRDKGDDRFVSLKNEVELMKLRSSWQQSEFSWRNVLWIGAVHLIALVGAVPYFSWAGFATFILFYYITGMIGITFGFHRLLAHHGFHAPRWLENFAALCGTLACQGGPINWIGTHRVHHAYSDTPRDPHDVTKGFWYAHFGWLVNLRCDLAQFDEYKHYAPDLAKRPFFVFLENYMIHLQVVLGLSLFALGGTVFAAAPTGFDFHMAMSFTIWGIFVRMIAMYHVTWCVNSVAHMFGDNANRIGDHSKNNAIIGVLAFGEGWHNNHHAHARFARHGWRWWQLDQTWIMIRALEILGVVKNVVRPTEEAIHSQIHGRPAKPQPQPQQTSARPQAPVAGVGL
jgi:stearoyl-CoA desaturase (delta-9 desaturase)